MFLHQLIVGHLSNIAKYLDGKHLLDCDYRGNGNIVLLLQYYSLFPSLTEPIHHVVTPYHWLDTEAIGGAADARFQGLAATSNPVATELAPTGQARYRSEIDGYTSVTGWIARHPELLRSYQEH